jgi:hypothetical protein
MLTLMLLALQAEVTKDAVVWPDGLRYERTKAVGQSACYFHPLTTPKGLVLTDVAPKDHPHHRGIFLGWVQMNGAKDADFWGWGQPAPTKDRQIVNLGVVVKDGAVVIANDWVAEELVVLRERTRVRLQEKDGIRILDLEILLYAEHKTTIARWAFSGFAVRAKKDGIKSVEGPAGAVDLKAPSHTKPETNWPDAAWYGFQYDAGGVAVAGRPGNPPSTWHVAKGIGLLNPAPQAVAPLVIEEEKPLNLAYRVMTWDGPTPREALNRLVTN